MLRFSSNLRSRVLTVVVLAATATGANKTTLGDTRMANEPRLFSDSSGRFYARSVPSANSGSAGKTEVYRVGRDEDTLEFSFGWFSWRVWLQRVRVGGGYGISVIRLGGHPSQLPGGDGAVLSFYLDDQLLAEYSLIDIALVPENVMSSVSSKSAINQVLGYRRVRGQEYVFELCTHDARVMSFDAQTGDLVGDEQDRQGLRCTYAQRLRSRLEPSAD